MAYENYNQVSWTDMTPITSLRLQQVSTNIEQVKTQVDTKATGVLKLKTVSASTANISGFSEYQIIELTNLSSNSGVDSRVSISNNRYYKVSVNLPSISILNPGTENASYTIKIYNGLSITDTGKAQIAGWTFTPPPFTFINVNAQANVSLLTISNNYSIKSNTNPTIFCGGTYSVIKQTISAATNQSFCVSIQRNAVTSNTNAPNYRVDASAALPLQIYVEDVGGT